MPTVVNNVVVRMGKRNADIWIIVSLICAIG